MKAIYFTKKELDNTKIYWIYIPEIKLAFSNKCGIVSDVDKINISDGINIAVDKTKIKKILKFIELNTTVDKIIDEIFKGI